ncbi:hypothetical protein M404DRAFT_996458 [Pisolithus tinctorius Marx 270]|uniref:Uncharacterized protein n=1 Tax=Pisolithus tinctorius Marx 270 TaxID=870435 RepID=A0A0C3KJ67_PISTI|nr:hypothetical protein M404DRAFT_996458 [Pisolithus tinctorius Marx 270]
MDVRSRSLWARHSHSITVSDDDGELFITSACGLRRVDYFARFVSSTSLWIPHSLIDHISVHHIRFSFNSILQLTTLIHRIRFIRLYTIRPFSCCGNIYICTPLVLVTLLSDSFALLAVPPVRRPGYPCFVMCCPCRRFSSWLRVSYLLVPSKSG